MFFSKPLGRFPSILLEEHCGILPGIVPNSKTKHPGEKKEEQKREGGGRKKDANCEYEIRGGGVRPSVSFFTRGARPPFCRPRGHADSSFFASPSRPGIRANELRHPGHSRAWRFRRKTSLVDRKKARLERNGEREWKRGRCSSENVSTVTFF